MSSTVTPSVTPTATSTKSGAESDPLLRVENLSMTYRTRTGPVRAVRDVTFELQPRTRYGLVGESGCGKSSVVRSMVGLVRPPAYVKADRLELAGFGDLSRRNPKEVRAIRGTQIGYVPQNPFGALHPVLSVGNQFHRYLKAHDRASSWRESMEMAALALLSLGITDPERVLRGHAGALSGGMAQRVVIAFACLLSPRLIVADEPTTALDVTVQRQVLELLASNDSEDQYTLLIATHDLSVVAQYCDEVLVMYAGRIIESGPVEDVFLRPSHPYTASLLNSIPRAGHELKALSGAPPDLHVERPGCDFADRCELVNPQVCGVRPPLEQVTADHLAACWFKDNAKEVV
jgi:oligopeptide/dipeptide ABC transporter ATP-binding protein